MKAGNARLAPPPSPLPTGARVRARRCELATHRRLRASEHHFFLLPPLACTPCTQWGRWKGGVLCSQPTDRRILTVTCVTFVRSRPDGAQAEAEEGLDGAAAGVPARRGVARHRSFLAPLEPIAPPPTQTHSLTHTTPHTPPTHLGLLGRLVRIHRRAQVGLLFQELGVFVLQRCAVCGAVCGGGGVLWGGWCTVVFWATEAVKTAASAGGR